MTDATYFDQWYTDIATSPARDVLIARALGLPEELARFAGVVPWAGVGQIGAALLLPADAILVDVACGRGAYGVGVAQASGARLIGVDFSAVALKQAEALAAQRLPAGRSEFRIGMLVATGLPAGSANGLMCLDAVQFAEPPGAALAEFRRVLAPGGRLVLTSWEALDPADARVPARIRAMDLRRGLPEAGFVEVEVSDRPGWRRAERALWETAVAATDSDPAVRALREEGRRSLATFDSMRRVFATATAPA